MAFGVIVGIIGTLACVLPGFRDWVIFTVLHFSRGRTEDLETGPSRTPSQRAIGFSEVHDRPSRPRSLEPRVSVGHGHPADKVRSVSAAARRLSAYE